MCSCQSLLDRVMTTGTITGKTTLDISYILVKFAMLPYVNLLSADCKKQTYCNSLNAHWMKHLLAKFSVDYLTTMCTLLQCKFLNKTCHHAPRNPQTKAVYKHGVWLVDCKQTDTTYLSTDPYETAFNTHVWRCPVWCRLIEITKPMHLNDQPILKKVPD